MGLCQSHEELYAIKRNQDIERGIEDERAENSRILKLLLLGAAESGKSTILKQMRIIHDGGFSAEEFRQMRAVVHNNTVNAMHDMLVSMKRFNILLTNPRLEDSALHIAELVATENDSEPFSPQTFKALKSLWADPGIQKVWGMRTRLQFLDSTKYFMEALDRTCQSDYMPTNQDILRTRVKTTGITEIKFKLNEETELRVIDVGGQRSERKKWIHCFDDVNGIVFVVSLSGYEQVIREDEKTNRILEAMRLFSTICNNDYFLHSSIILFLNKKDLFIEKIRQVPLTLCFPDYKGPGSYEDAADYIQEQFERLSKVPSQSIFVHRTCGTDTTQMRFVIDTCFDLLMQRNLQSCGLY